MAQLGKDVIIVRAGAASCVLANRSTADSDRKVLLLKAGPSEPSRGIAATPAFSHLGLRRSFRPQSRGPMTRSRPFRAHSRSIYHPTGTCRMGIDEAAVVDPSITKVRGFGCLRVRDAFVFPDVVAAISC